MAITVRFAWALAFILVGVTSPGTTAGVVIGLTVVAAASLHDARNQTLRHWSLSSLSWRRRSVLDRQTLSPGQKSVWGQLIASAKPASTAAFAFSFALAFSGEAGS